MTLARGVVVGALALGVAAAAFLLLSGGGGPTYTLVFENSGQLVNGNQVQISGRPIGRITDIGLTENNQAKVEIELTDSSLEALPEGTRATVRQPSLSSAAGRYVSLQLGTGAPLASGTTIPTTSTTSTVDLDQLFSTFDAATRENLAQFIRGSATWFDGRGVEANETTKWLAPALSSTSRLVREISGDQATFESLIVNVSDVVGALAERRESLTELVANTNEATGALAEQRTALDASLAELPTTIRRGNSTFANLRATLDDLEPLVDVSLEQTKDLEPFLRELRPLLQEAEPTVADLSQIVRRDGADNDLTDLMRTAPKLARVATPSFRNTTRAINDSLPLLTFARPYAPDLVGTLRDFGQTTAYFDANGHFARVQTVTNTFAYDRSTNTLTPQDPARRLDGVSSGNIRRCPGTAGQRPEDGSAPYTDGGRLDCDVTKVLSGP